MTRDVSRYLAPDFLSLTIGIVVYFVGVLITQWSAPLMVDSFRRQF